MYHTLSQARLLEARGLPWSVRLVMIDPARNHDKFWEARSSSQPGVAVYSYGKRGTRGRGPADKPSHDVLDTAAKKLTKGYVYEENSGVLPGVFGNARTISTTADLNKVAILDENHRLIAHTTAEGSKYLRVLIS